MILTRQEAKDYSNEPRPDLNYVEDGIYPASFVKCSEEQGQYGPQIKWLFTLDEVNKIKIFVSLFTSTSWAPGNKLDGLLVSLGIDTTNNFDLATFNTDMIKGGTKILLMVSKKRSQKGNIYLKVDKYLPYSPNARGAEPLMFPQEHMIMPEPQQQSQQFQQQQPPLKVNYQSIKPINNQPNGMYQQFQQQPYAGPSINPAPNMGQRVTNPTNQNFGTMPPVKKVDFGSKL